jgi:hypothetical protein
VDDRPWWLWPNLLSLDAPAVAVVWQQYLAARAGVTVPTAAAAVLGLVVWGVYLADRWLDARRGVQTAERHRFAAAHPRAVAIAAVFALVVAAVLAAELPPEYLEVGGVTAVALAGYLMAVHAGLDELLPGAKEAAVGLVFGGGVAVPLIADASPGATDWLAGVVAFAGLCWLNCALISRWEEPRADAPPGWTLLAAAGVAVSAAALDGPPSAAPVLVSAGLLGVLHLARGSLSARLRRVLADAVLLTPLVFGACA